MPETQVYEVKFQWGNRTMYVVGTGYGEVIDAALMQLPANTDFGQLHRCGIEITRLPGPVVLPQCPNCKFHGDDKATV